MNDSFGGESGARSRPGAAWLAPVVEQFQNAWKQALKGGPQPEIDSFLRGLTASDQPAVRSELETIERAFQQPLTERDSARLGATVEWQGPTLKLDETAQPAAQPPSQLEPTVNLDPAAKLPPRQETLPLPDEALGLLGPTLNLDPNAKVQRPAETALLGTTHPHARAPQWILNRARRKRQP